MERAMETEHAVHIVDDDPAVRRSLERLLYSAGYAHVAYQSAREFLEVASAIPAGCVLLDIKMPDIDGLEVLARLNRLRIALPVIVITGHGDIPTAVRAMKEGAADFIEKPFDDERLLAAIESVFGVSGLAPRAREIEIAEAAKRIATLSPRERQVLDALVAGQQSKVIAYHLGLSVRTVEVHRARMMERLGIRHFAEAVRLSVLAGLAHDGRRLVDMAPDGRY